MQTPSQTAADFTRYSDSELRAFCVDYAARERALPAGKERVRIQRLYDAAYREERLRRVARLAIEDYADMLERYGLNKTADYLENTGRLTNEERCCYVRLLQQEG